MNERKVTIQRLVRDTKISQTLKSSYNQCQLCRIRLRKPSGEYITEAHHIRPYNKQHLGDDNIRNLIVLCPNCHVLFDNLFFAIDPNTYKVHNIEDSETRDLFFVSGHQLGQEYLLYTWNLFNTLRKNNEDS
ncbi:HNH endonuclease [Neobacillus drentensis]|uniref:HNH endonuclease n=1 Tax=Neobacillus drentensis TaxID=220684 RepID=UPI003B5885E6